MNNLLVTIFNVMGLAPADYERNGVVGFGDYEGQQRREVCAVSLHRSAPEPAPVPLPRLSVPPPIPAPLI